MLSRSIAALTPLEELSSGLGPGAFIVGTDRKKPLERCAGLYVWLGADRRPESGWPFESTTRP